MDQTHYTVNLTVLFGPKVKTSTLLSDGGFSSSAAHRETVFQQTSKTFAVYHAIMTIELPSSLLRDIEEWAQ